MLPPRILGLLVILLAVQGLCKPNKGTEELDYEDDTPFDEEDEEDEDEKEDDIFGIEPPQILSQKMNVSVKAGSTVILPCQVNTENYAITWEKDNKILYFEAKPQIEDFKRIVRLPNNSLIIYNATVDDSSDNYKCSILYQPYNINITHHLLVDSDRNQLSQHSHKGIIRVIPSQRVEVFLNKSIQLGCETDIQPPPEIKWFIESKKADEYDPDVILEGDYITIKKANKSHSGLYQCLVEDGSKMPPMGAIKVFVNYAPEIEVKEDIVYSGEGIESEMTCIVSAYPDALITWYKGEKPIIQKKGSIGLHHGIMKNNKTKHVLKIFYTSKHDFGEYKCRASNAIGQDIKSIILTGIPSQPRMYSAEVINGNSVFLLKWRLQSYSPIKEYKLQWRHKGDEKWKIENPQVFDDDRKGNTFIVEYPIKGIQLGSYEAILLAKNIFGWSASEPHTFTGDYPSEMAQKHGNSAAIHTPGILLALILVILSCAFTSL